jgi:ribosomal 30S subunit maturation factor RimM
MEQIIVEDFGERSMTQRQVVTEDIDKSMRVGLAVYDASGDRIGTVREYSTTAGYIMVQARALGHTCLYVPYRAIRTIDPKEIYLSLHKDELVQEYSAPPRSRMVVEHELAREVVFSGYDGSLVEVNRVNLETARKDLAVGMTVLDLNGERIGSVEGFDTMESYMLVSQIPGRNALSIPFGAIATIDQVYGKVFLDMPREMVQQDSARTPDGAMHGVRAGGASNAK